VNNIFTKRTAILVGLGLVVTGFILKHARDPKNKDSFVTKTAQTIGLVAA